MKSMSAIYDWGLSDLFLRLIVTQEIFCDLPTFYSATIVVIMCGYNQASQFKTTLHL